MSHVSVVPYYPTGESVAEALELSGAFDRLRSSDRVFIKPNIVFWSRQTQIPPWGVITTTKVVEDIIVALKRFGINHIIIGEGTITLDPRDTQTAAHAFDRLGYTALARRYGVTVVNLFEHPFRPVNLSNGTTIKLAENFLDADFIISLPVLKTHAQTRVSLSQKNLKGCLDMASRKAFHSGDPQNDLDNHIAAFMDILPEKICTVIDGIFSLERGPNYTGTAQRSDVLIASKDLLAADIVAAHILGIPPDTVGHIAKTCLKKGIAPSIDAVEIVGEPLDMWAKKHNWDFPYNADNTLPLQMDFMKIKGLSFPKYDSSLCSYCSGITGMLQAAITAAWKGIPFDNVEVLTGKMQRPMPGMNHTLLLGKCQVKLNTHHPAIKNAIKVNGCPPRIDDLITGLHKAGIDITDSFAQNIEATPELFMKKYAKKPQFSMDFFQANNA